MFICVLVSTVAMAVSVVQSILAHFFFNQSRAYIRTSLSVEAAQLVRIQSALYDATLTDKEKISKMHAIGTSFLADVENISDDATLLSELWQKGDLSAVSDRKVSP